MDAYFGRVMGGLSIDPNERFNSLGSALIVQAVIQFNSPPSQPFEPSTLRNVLEARLAG
jgi:hypothetical protein